MLETIQRVEEQILYACEKYSRNRQDIKLVAVSKTFPNSRIEEAYADGLRVFGESKAQEFRDKVRELPKDIEWHFIGHLQRNKIKYVAGKAFLVHSVDTLNLAQALSDYAISNSIEIAILMEVNTSAEDAKYGVDPRHAQDTFLEIYNLPRLKLKGLMTMAPFVSDEKQVRAAFSVLRNVKENLLSQLPNDTELDLSMGMSQDFQWAIAEGSTIIRVGTALFGSREVQ